MNESEPLAGQVPTIPKKKASSFAADVLKMVSGTTVAQALSVLVAPILSRLFPPEAFGTAGVFASLVGIIGVVVCLRYELAILLPDKDKDAANLFAGSLFFAGVFAGLTALGVLILRQPLARWLNAPALEPLLWLLPITVLASGVHAALRYWTARTKRFGLLSGMLAAGSVSMSGSKLATGLLGYIGPGSLIGSNLLTELVPAVGLGWQTWRHDKLLLLQVRWRQVMNALVWHRRFPLVTTWSDLLNALSLQLPEILLSAFFSQTIVGYYFLARRVLQLPMRLIARPIAQVFFQRASVAHHEGKLGQLIESTLVRLAALGFFPMLILMLVGQEIFVVVLGPTWGEAGLYAQILSLWILVAFIATPVKNTYLVLERQGTGLFFEVALLSSRMVALVIGGLLADARLALLLYAVLSTVVSMSRLAWLIRLSKASLRRIVAGFASYPLYAAPTLAILVAGKWWMHWPTWAILSIASLGGVLYYVLVGRRDKRIRGWVFSTWKGLVTRV